jgi:Choline/Carnitine o-acyltransferase
VPLPTLEESCERFLAWCAPLLTEDELAATQTAVASFLLPESPARKFQAALEQYNASMGVQSWFDAFWSYRYLGRPDRIALNANFFFLFEDSDEGQVERAAGLIAAVTPEVVRFVTVMDDPEADETTRRTAFRAAAGKHVERAKECQAGHAPEQHLWELQLIQMRRGEALGFPAPLALYETPGWLKMRDDYLSTSSTSSTNIQYGGFGPTSDRCIGLGYMLLPDRFSLHLSTRRPLAGEMLLFADELREAIRELHDLLASEQEQEQLRCSTTRSTA